MEQTFPRPAALGLEGQQIAGGINTGKSPWSYLVFAGLIPFVVMYQSGDFTPFNLGKNSLLLFIFLAWAIKIRLLRQQNEVNFGFIKYFFFFFFTAFFSCLAASDKLPAFITLAKWLRFVFIYLLVANTVKNRALLDTFLRVFAFFIGCACIYGIYEFFFHPDFYHQLIRATSIFDMPTLWAFFLVSLLPFVFFLFYEERVLMRKYFYLFLLVLMYINLLLARSRLGYLFGTAIFILSPWCCPTRRGNIFLSGLKNRIIVISAAVILSGLFLLTLQIRGAVTLGDDPSFIARLDYQRIAFKIIEAHPFLGIGPGNYPVVSSLFAPYHYFDHIGLKVGVHNVYLHIAMEYGLIAMLVFVIFILIHMRSLVKMLRGSKDACLQGFLPFLLLSLSSALSFFAFDILPHTLMEWYLGIALGLVAAISNVAHERSPVK